MRLILLLGLRQATKVVNGNSGWMTNNTYMTRTKTGIEWDLVHLYDNSLHCMVL